MYFLYYQARTHGPYALDQIRSMWASGVITADAVYWVQADSVWKPIAELLATERSEQTNAPEFDSMKSRREAANEPAPPPRPHTTKTEPLRYAGFWPRLISLLLDALIYLPLAALVFWGYLNHRLFALYYLIPGTLFGLFFYVYLVQRFGGTPGKLITGIRIRKVDGEPVSYREAFLRYLPALILGLLISIAMIASVSQITDVRYHSLSFMEQAKLEAKLAPSWYQPLLLINQIWFWGELLILLTNRKRRALHDFIAGTVVVRVAPVAKSKPEGVEGWLGFFVVSLILFIPTAIVISVFSSYIANDIVRPLDRAAAHWLDSRMALNAPVLFTLVIFSIVTGILLVCRTRNAVLVAKCFTAAIPLVLLAALLADLTGGGPAYIRETFVTSGIMAMIPALGCSAIWFTYLCRSRRVRNTYGGDADAPSSKDEPESASKAAGEPSTPPAISPLFQRLGAFIAFVIAGLFACVGIELSKEHFPRSIMASMLFGAVGGALGALVVELPRRLLWRRDVQEKQPQAAQEATAPSAKPDTFRRAAAMVTYIAVAICVLFIFSELFSTGSNSWRNLFGHVATEETVANHPDYKAAKAAEKIRDDVTMLKHAKALVDLYPKSGLALRCLGDVLCYTEAYQEAVTTLNKAIALDPNDVVAWDDLAVAYENIKLPFNADAAFQKALNLAEKQPKPWADFGAYCLSQGRKGEADKATEHAARLLDESPFDTHHGEWDEASVWLRVGENYLHLEKPFLAEQMLKRATELASQNGFAWHLLGNALYDQKKNDQALAAFLSATKLDPKNAVAWDMLALCYSVRGDKESELAAYRQAVATDPRGFVGWRGLGYIYDDRGGYLDAIDCWEKALSIEPNDRDTLVMLAGEYEKAGRLDDAIAGYEKLVKLNPSVSGWSLLAGAYDKKGRLQDAIIAYREVVRMNPSSSTDWYWAGDYFWRMGSTDEAIAAFEKFASLENRSSMERSDAILTLAYANGLIGKNAEAKRLYDRAMSINGESIQWRSNERLNYLKTALREKVRQGR